MHILSKISPVTKAAAVIGSVMVLATSVTFATLQDTATLTGNTISTINSTSDGLLVDSDHNGSYGKTDEGFTFSGIKPGTKSHEKTFKLKNTTNEDIDVYVQVTGESPLPAGVDPDDIKFIFDVPGAADVKATWGEIIPTDGVLLLSGLNADEEVEIHVKVKIDDSVTEDVSIAPFNFTFGTLEDAMTTSQVQ